MFTIKLIATTYGTMNTVSTIAGYMLKESDAKQFCIENTPKLEYDKSRGVAYYNYEKTDDVSAAKLLSYVNNNSQSESPRHRSRRHKGLGMRGESRFVHNR